MSRRKKSPRRGPELWKAGLIWEGTAEEFRQILWDVKTQIEGMTEEEKRRFYEREESGPPASEP